MRLAAVALAIVLVASPNDRAMDKLREWARAVDDHTVGETDAAFNTVTAWTHADLELMQAYVDALADVPLNTRDRDIRRRQIPSGELSEIRARRKDLQQRGDFDRFRKRAAMLHTDAAIFGDAPVVVDPPAMQQRRPASSPEQRARVDVKSFDGRVERFELANPHWQYAMDLLEALPATPQRDPIVAQWYRAVGAYFANEHRYADAIGHFAQARRVVPDDPLVLYGQACLEETLGAPRIQDYVRVTTLPNGLSITGIFSPETHLRRAEAMLRKALAADPHFVDARLRLGRVLSGLRQHDAALAHFAQVVAESHDQVLTYYAHVFAGDAALALDRPAESRGAYERALDSYPNAQAARLGLGAALRAAGDRQGAINAVMTTLVIPAASRDQDDDPWWEYYEGDAANVDRLLHGLHVPFRSAAR